jgi:hypothetical protein
MAEKFVVFEDAAKELQKSPDELKALVDEGKIRSFMDGGKMKFRRKDLDDLKASLGITTEEEELSLAPPEELPEVPPMPAEEPEAAAPEEAPEVPPPAPADEDEFTIEPLDEGEARMTPGTGGKKGEAAPKAAPAKGGKAAKAEAGTEDEVASLSDFEISEDVEEKGQELGEEEAELLSVQAPAFRSFEETEAPSPLLTVVLVASTFVLAFAAIVIMSFAWDVNISSLTSLWPAQ